MGNGGQVMVRLAAHGLRKKEEVIIFVSKHVFLFEILKINNF
jgi:hypothetical protein